MNELFGYAKELAQLRIKQQSNKPLFGKPYLKLGQCYMLWAYFFQLGGILGKFHTNNLDAFGLAFLGLKGESGAVENFFLNNGKRITEDFPLNSIKFEEYIFEVLKKQFDFKKSEIQFMEEYFSKKTSPEIALKKCWQFAIDGASLAVYKSDIIEDIFERSHFSVPKSQWKAAYDAGLDVSPEQDLLTYNETEVEENESFMVYCKSCNPSLFKILGK